MEQRYRSIITTSQGRPGWIIAFTHPFATGPDGRRLPKVRRGLGTPNENEARGLSEQMNRLLDDPTLWSPEAKGVAVGQGFDPRIIKIFYDHPSPIPDPWTIRDTVIPLPTKREKLRNGIAVAQLVGQTGSCKTTLLRRLLGTTAERFPSTSISRTTTFDIEAIAELSDYSAVVTFLPRGRVHQRIEECARTAIFKFIDTVRVNDLARKFLEDPKQRFRLNYILGDFSYQTPSDGSGSRTTLDASEGSNGIVHAFIQRLHIIAEAAIAAAEQRIGSPYNRLDSDGKLRFEEEVDEFLEGSEEFRGFIEDVLDAVEERFRAAERIGDIIRHDDDWPSYWTLRHSDRSTFFDPMRCFSNLGEEHGALLTPLVDGIRIKGPFQADWMTAFSQWVVLDGEGLGHSLDSTSAVPISITKRFDLADAIILTDRSDASMQAPSVAVLKSLVNSGHDSKLIVCFTKFDTTRDDDSRPRLLDRQNHLRNAFDSVVSEIATERDPASRYRLAKAASDRMFFLQDLNAKELSDDTQSELLRLVGVATSMRPPEKVAARPIYDLNLLPMRVQNAAKEFHSRWRARLGLEVSPQIDRAPWQRIKALSHYSSELDPTGFANLVPVDDFAAILEAHISTFIQQPVGWNFDDVTPEEAAEAVAAIKRQVHTLLGGFAVRRLIQEQQDRWKAAYERRGPGSTKPRARDIDGLYGLALPIPDEVPPLQASVFVQLLMDLVKNGIHAGNGLLQQQAVPVET